MARYIDADKFIAHLKDELKECEIPLGSRANGKGIAYGTALGLKSAISFADTLSTADVVPKSEVERLQEEANRYKRYFFRHDYDEMIAEVLDKLDRFIKSNCIEIKDERGIKGYVTSGVHFAIAELKKKYTEGKQ